MKTSEKRGPAFDVLPSPEDISQIAVWMQQAGLETLELSDGKGARLFLRVAGGSVSRPIPHEETAPAEPSARGIAVKAPYFGHLGLTGLAKPGKIVKRDDVLAFLTLGNLQIPVQAPMDGTVVDVLGQDGELAGYGAVILHLEPA
ncbi:biotin/lipoyl-containing protein [Gluconobacter morbifer]|uniref:Lipoyl-binding domain-containing protein n=1 Tax=Gluconobacter morbifer G707 TaxID=1088869 RepID=G6XFF7_9PROT|nr:biotin/lipoyl-containing protein [Gluconobacter morbifer]EHH68915.1 hypothetical protein GMO_02220 [Gluconobacter morbifer G707]